MKIIKLRALSERGDYTYNTVQMFVWVMYVHPRFLNLSQLFLRNHYANPNHLTDFHVSTEGCLVDIAASVPLIRPLFTRSGLTSTTNTYEMRDFSGQKGISSNSRAFTSRSNSGTVKLSDGGSEEGILPMQGTNNGTILKQTSYVVEYDVEKQERNPVRLNPYRTSSG